MSFCLLLSSAASMAWGFEDALCPNLREFGVRNEIKIRRIWGINENKEKERGIRVSILQRLPSESIDRAIFSNDFYLKSKPQTYIGSMNYVTMSLAIFDFNSLKLQNTTQTLFIFAEEYHEFTL